MAQSQPTPPPVMRGPQLVGHERHDRVQQPEQLVEHVPEHPPGRPAAASSPEASGTLASSRYQSQTSSQAKWYSTSQTLPNSYCSNSSSTSAMTADSRDRIHRSDVE